MSDEYGRMPASDTVRLERLLPGPAERLWSYLTESEKRGRWLAQGEMGEAVGGRVELVFMNSQLTEGDDPPPPKYAEYAGESRMKGRITAWDPPRVLAYTWGEPSGETSEVTFELAPRAGNVLLVVTHRRLATREGMVSVAAGWHAHLAILADRLEGREPAGFWRTHTRLEAEYEKRIPSSPTTG